MLKVIANTCKHSYTNIVITCTTGFKVSKKGLIINAQNRSLLKIDPYLKDDNIIRDQSILLFSLLFFFPKIFFPTYYAQNLATFA